MSNAYSFALSWWNSLGPELPPLQQVQDFKISFNKKYDEVKFKKKPVKIAIRLLEFIDPIKKPFSLALNFLTLFSSLKFINPKIFNPKIFNPNPFV